MGVAAQTGDQPPTCGLPRETFPVHCITMREACRTIGYVAYHKTCALKRAHCHVLMPLSPLGGDGLCSEAKIGLEVLLERWRSEGWSDGISTVRTTRLPMALRWVYSIPHVVHRLQIVAQGCSLWKI